MRRLCVVRSEGDPQPAASIKLPTQKRIGISCTVPEILCGFACGKLQETAGLGFGGRDESAPHASARSCSLPPGMWLQVRRGSGLKDKKGDRLHNSHPYRGNQLLADKGRAPSQRACPSESRPRGPRLLFYSFGLLSGFTYHRRAGGITRTTPAITRAAHGAAHGGAHGGANSRTAVRGAAASATEEECGCWGNHEPQRQPQDHY
jgi:hypothetical protein